MAQILLKLFIDMNKVQLTDIKPLCHRIVQYIFQCNRTISPVCHICIDMSRAPASHLLGMKMSMNVQFSVLDRDWLMTEDQIMDTDTIYNIIEPKRLVPLLGSGIMIPADKDLGTGDTLDDSSQEIFVCCIRITKITKI